jgi:hypothetical protein
MDKLLRTNQSQGDAGELPEIDAVSTSIDQRLPELEQFEQTDQIEIADAETRQQTYFANLGAPRERHPNEYTPNVYVEEKPRLVKMKTPHFKLIPAGSIFEETSNASMVKYGILALFIGISVTSFLTQGVLAVKDMVFGPSAEELKLAEENAEKMAQQNLKDLHSNKVLAESGGESLGSDDSFNSASSSTAGLNQYRLANETSFPRLSSKSYLAADLQTGEIILEQNDTLIAPIASVSKLMTAVVTEENMDLQKIAIVSRDSYNAYGTQGELLLGEKIKVYDLMYPLLTESSNDAAEVLADAYDKGRDAFMALMNKKAVELGMNDTYYEDPSGLSPKNVSSIHDLLKLGRYVYQKHPNLYSMTRVRQYAILKHTWFNQNRFLNYDTFLGGKNGYIDESKKTTVSLFDVTMARGGKRQVVIVLLKSDDREGDALKIINFLKKNAYYQEVAAGVN